MKPSRVRERTPFKADFAAALACLLPLPLVAAPVVTYASAIALKELAISATAGAHPPHRCGIARKSRFQMLKMFGWDCKVAEWRNNDVESCKESERRLYLSWYPWEAC